MRLAGRLRSAEGGLVRLMGLVTRGGLWRVWTMRCQVAGRGAGVLVVQVAARGVVCVSHGLQESKADWLVSLTVR